MGKIKKKGSSGQAKNYITRTQAVRKLQISLPDFRRLCIFKGIYPREPRNKKKASKSSTPSTTFYYTRDIQYLLHEPLLAKFREHKALSKKIARFLGRGEIDDAARLEKKNAPKLSLDHIIKERYPTFVDALRDLDDALSLLSLFANLPATSTVPPKTIALCQRLCLEFQHYLITTNSLQKSFLSIKGIYYQATIQGQDILWLVPYKFVQRVTGQVDFRIMGTFVDFYTTLLGFVNFRLYNTVGLVYPPKFDAKSDEQGGELGVFTLQGKGISDHEQGLVGQNEEHEEADAGQQQLSEETRKEIEGISNGPETEVEDSAGQGESHGPEEDFKKAIDTFEPVALDADALVQPAKPTDAIASLFAPFTFYLSRETPRQPLEFLLRAFGCRRVGWDAALGQGAYTDNEADPSITHQVVDRPPVDAAAQNDEGPQDAINGGFASGYRVAGRTYIQPQWVWDCVNEIKLLRADLYAPGATLPPHLSPWVKPSKGQYDPKVPLAEQEEEGEAAEAEEALAESARDDADLEQDEMEGDGVAITSNGHENHLLSEDTAKIPGTDEDTHGMDITLGDEDSEDSESILDGSDDEEGSAFNGFDNESETQTQVLDNDDHDDDDPAVPSKTLHQLELEAEAANSTTKPPLKSILKKPSVPVPVLEAETTRVNAARRRHEAAEEIERRKMMLPQKKRKMYEKMVYSQTKAEGVARGLREKRRRIEIEQTQTQNQKQKPS